MSNFIKFKKALQAQLEKMSKSQIFVVDVDKDVLWNTYLDSFPEGTNNLYKERREYDCNCCRGFIKNVGAAVVIKSNGELESIWDIKVEGYYQPVVDALAALIKTKKVAAPFYHFEHNLGVNRNKQLLDNGVVKEWEHFYAATPTGCYLAAANIPTKVGDYKSTFDVLKRSVEELTLDSAETVLELINQNSLYRGAEFKDAVKKFIQVKKEYDKTSQKENYLWLQVMKEGHAMRFRNTAIGTLLTDLSEGKDLDAAVGSFEAKVAPTNYKRTSSLITQGMIDQAKKKIDELGLEDSLHRRFAAVDDLTINNVLFADRSIKKAMNAFDELLVPTKKKEISKVEEISVEKFLSDVLPSATSVEVMFENKHTNNLVSLIAPKYHDAKPLFKWGNNFSWSYVGEVTDSIKERVKAAGGVVDAPVRVSLSWFNHDDLDLSVITPGNNQIYFGNRRCIYTGGQLDVDMNAGCGTTRTPVENIFWSDVSKMKEGVYQVEVHNFSQREKRDVGFDVQFEALGETLTISNTKGLSNRGRVVVLKFEYTRKNGIKLLGDYATKSRSTEVWGINTNQFQKVSMIMNSPNHWDGEEVGNKHLFFMIDGCKNPDSARGFYNEFLKNELNPHRKVFEVLSSKMKTPESDNQLSGLGFSTTKHDEVVVKVVGKFERILKIKF